MHEIFPRRQLPMLVLSDLMDHLLWRERAISVVLLKLTTPCH